MALPTQDSHLVSQRNELEFQRGAAAHRNESRESTAARRVIMSTTVWPWYTKRYTCSAFPSFEQAHPYRASGLVQSPPIHSAWITL